MELKYDIAVRVKPLENASIPNCLTVAGHGEELVVERGSVRSNFRHCGAVFRGDGGLQGQEEVFKELRDKALDVLHVGGHTAVVAFGGKGSGKSYTLFGKVEGRSPARRTRPSTPRDGLRQEGLLLRFSAHLLPAMVTFTEVTSLGEKCLLTGSSSEVSPFRVSDNTTLARLVSRALCSAAEGGNIVAVLRHIETRGTLVLAELCPSTDPPFRHVVSVAGERVRDLVYPIEEEMQRHPIPASLGPLLLRRCNYGIAIACVDPTPEKYNDTVRDLRFLDKWTRVPLWPIPAGEEKQEQHQLVKKQQQQERNAASSLAVRLEEERKLRREAEEGLRELRVAVEQGRRELEAVREESHQAAAGKAALEVAAEEQRATITRLEQEMRDVSSVARDLSSHSRDTETELSRVEARARRGSEIRQQIAGECEALRSEVATLSRECEQLREEAAASKAEAATLRRHGEETDAKSLEAFAEKAQADLQIASLRTEVQSLQAEVIDLRRAPALYEPELQRLAKAERSSRLQAAKAARARQDKERELRVLEEARARDREVIQELNRALAEAKAQVKQVRIAADETIDALSESLNRTAAQLQKEREEGDRLRKELRDVAETPERQLEEELLEDDVVGVRREEGSSLLEELAKE